MTVPEGSVLVLVSEGDGGDKGGGVGTGLALGSGWCLNDDRNDLGWRWC